MSAIEKVIQIHKLNLPMELNDIISRFAVNLLECEKCGKVLRRTHKDKISSWYTEGEQTICVYCHNSNFSLQSLYKKRFKK